MSEAIKTFQTLDSNSKISLIILKGLPVVCFEKMPIYVYKVSHCGKYCMFQLVLSVTFI